jgi:hypothetical protein
MQLGKQAGQMIDDRFTKSNRPSRVQSVDVLLTRPGDPFFDDAILATNSEAVDLESCGEVWQVRLGIRTGFDKGRLSLHVF